MRKERIQSLCSLHAGDTVPPTLETSAGAVHPHFLYTEEYEDQVSVLGVDVIKSLYFQLFRL